ncbi:MAG TPA: outer membrane beta-barrel protein [Xanthobacteraceae bacterium]|nr:outer membrane beta-barrel protein [Xanthobacteraceae bacterium]
MKRLLLGTAALIAAAAVSPARAADLAVKAPIAPAVTFSWTGCYIGANGGGSSDDSHFTTSVDPGTHLNNPADLAAIGAAGTTSLLDGGAFVGGEAGCNWQTGQFVAGLEGDFDYHLIASTPLINGTGTLANGSTFAFIDSMRINWLATVRPRVGLAVDRNLFYVTGGVAFSNVTLTQTYNDTFNNAVGSSALSKTLTGWAVGGGWEVAFEQHVSFKIE